MEQGSVSDLSSYWVLLEGPIMGRAILDQPGKRVENE